MTHYRATWSPLLRVVSGGATLLCVSIVLHEWPSLLSGDFRQLPFWLAVLPLGLLIGAALCTVRGYSVTPDAILIHRLGWKTQLSRQALESVEYRPGLLSRSLRTFGNGGLFSFTGWYYNRDLGAFRAYATDSQRSVVLWIRGKKFVLSPDEPERFVRELLAKS